MKEIIIIALKRLHAIYPCLFYRQFHNPCLFSFSSFKSRSFKHLVLSAPGAQSHDQRRDNSVRRCHKNDAIGTEVGHIDIKQMSLSYEPLCPSVGRLIGRSVDWSIDLTQIPLITVKSLGLGKCVCNCFLIQLTLGDFFAIITSNSFDLSFIVHISRQN